MTKAWPEPATGYRPISRIGKPLSDKEIVAMGYDPTPNGWMPFRKELIPPATDPKPQPEQQSLVTSPTVPKRITKATPKRPTPRKGRTARPSRKKK